MMAGLMMVFLFIAVLFMNEIQKEKIAIKEIAESYHNIKQKLHDDLMREFKDDMKKWDAEILPDNTIRFKSPDVLFVTGKAQIRPFFQSVINDFFPRYLNILTNETYRNKIQEVRVEGHTSSIWKHANRAESYLKNMRLSQARSRSVLEYSYKVTKSQHRKRWLEDVFRANGMSFSKLIVTNGVENKLASQRVEFRVLTKAEEKIYEILDELQVTGKGGAG